MQKTIVSPAMLANIKILRDRVHANHVEKIRLRIKVIQKIHYFMNIHKHNSGVATDLVIGSPNMEIYISPHEGSNYPRQD